MKTNNLQRLIFTDTGSIDFYQDANLNGQNITKTINVSGKTNTDLTVEALGTGDIIFKTNNIDRLKITDTGTFIGLPDPAGWTYIVKSANQDVTNNATPQDDTELQFSVVAGGHYMVILDLVISANNTTSAYLGRFQISSGTMKGHGIATIPNASGSANIFSQNANAVAQTVGFISGPPVGDLDQLLSGTIIFSFTASSNAIFKYQFSGQVSGAGRTSRTWKGSILKYKRID